MKQIVLFAFLPFLFSSCASFNDAYRGYFDVSCPAFTAEEIKSEVDSDSAAVSEQMGLSVISKNYDPKTGYLINLHGPVIDAFFLLHFGPKPDTGLGFQKLEAMKILSRGTQKK